MIGLGVLEGRTSEASGYVQEMFDLETQCTNLQQRGDVALSTEYSLFSRVLVANVLAIFLMPLLLIKRLAGHMKTEVSRPNAASLSSQQMWP